MDSLSARALESGFLQKPKEWQSFATAQETVVF